MELRSGLYKGVHGVLPIPHRAQFEEGVNLLFSSWTALCLAIDNAWGGPGSRQKAEQLYQDVLAWFYGHTGIEHVVLPSDCQLDSCGTAYTRLLLPVSTAIRSLSAIIILVRRVAQGP